jgi:hypothetical protein
MSATPEALLGRGTIGATRAERPDNLTVDATAHEVRIHSGGCATPHNKRLTAKEAKRPSADQVRLPYLSLRGRGFRSVRRHRRPIGPQVILTR